MKITKEQLAARLNGRQYGDEITREGKLAKENGLAVIFGASDDLCEMRGAIDDEFGCCDGGEIECEEYPGKLRAVWCPKSGGSWEYETDLPHATFEIYEDDELYCVGIVVDLKECQVKDGGARNGWISVNEKLPPEIRRRQDVHSRKDRELREPCAAVLPAEISRYRADKRGRSGNSSYRSIFSDPKKCE